MKIFELKGKMARDDWLDLINIGVIAKVKMTRSHFSNEELYQAVMFILRRHSAQ